MRCPDCNKFTSFEAIDPEVECLSVDGDGINADVRVCLTCADCGVELKEYLFQVSDQVPDEIFEAHKGAGHELEAEEGCVESTDQTVKGVRRYGFHLEIQFSCSCAKDIEGFVEVSDSTPSSDMDEIA
jgi:hypothetical protein